MMLVLAACARPAPAPPPPARASAEAVFATLSLRDKVAQLVVPWIDGAYTARDGWNSAAVRSWVDSLHVGGVLVSVGSATDVAAKLNDLQRRSKLPLLVASDLEGGTAFRLNGGTPFPPNMGVAAAGRDEDAYAIGRATALEGRAVGIHMTFAPVADVNSNPDNPVINTRSYGEDPALVSRLVAASIRGIQDGGMLAVVKHFPGHGDVATDTHLDLPSLDVDWRRLDSVELRPFRAAIAAGVTGVMSAHIALPTIDAGQHRPATLAPPILTGILRDSLGFRGLVVTDALNMGSLVRNYPAGEVAVQAFLAGSDIFVQPADPRATIDAVTRAVEGGRIPMARLDEAVRRMLALKERIGLFHERLVPLDSVTTRVGRSATYATSLDIARRSIVLVKDSLGALDSLRRGPRPVAVISYGDDRSPLAGVALAAELRVRGYPVSLFRLWPQSGSASYDSARAIIAQRGTAVFALAVRALPWAPLGITVPDSLATLVDSTARARPTVLVSLGSPYIVRQTPSVGSYLLGWLSSGVTETAVAGALAGDPITGRLPTRVPPAYAVGDGLTRPAVVRVTGPASAGAR